MQISTWEEWRQPSSAAEPVSPEVAPRMSARLPFRRSHVIEHPAQDLQGEVLEGQGRAVKQLEHMFAIAQRRQRSDFRVSETGVTRLDHAAQFVFRESAGS